MVIPILVLAINSFNSAFPDQNTQGKIRTGIVVMQTPSDQKKMNITHMVMEVNPTENKISLSFGLNYFTNGTFSIGISLPFQIDSISEVATPPYPGNWSYENFPSGSLVIISYTDQKISSIGAEGIIVGKNLKIKHNIVDKIYDTSNLDLPFRGYITEEISQLTQEKSLIKSNSIFPTTLKIALPPYAPITTGTHNPTEKLPGKDYVVWVYYLEEEFTPFYVQYSIPEDRTQFQFNLIWSGVLFGVALSIFFTTIHSFLDKYFKGKKPDTKSEQPSKSIELKEISEKEEKYLLIEYEQLHNEIQQRNQYSWLIISIFVTASFIVSFGVYSSKILPLHYAVSLGLASFACFLYVFFSHVNKSCWKRRKEIQDLIGINGPSVRYGKLKNTLIYKISKLIWIAFWFFLIILYFHLLLFSIL